MKLAISETSSIAGKVLTTKRISLSVIPGPADNSLSQLEESEHARASVLDTKAKATKD